MWYDCQLENSSPEPKWHERPNKIELSNCRSLYDIQKCSNPISHSHLLIASNDIVKHSNEKTDLLKKKNTTNEKYKYDIPLHLSTADLHTLFIS